MKNLTVILILLLASCTIHREVYVTVNPSYPEWGDTEDIAILNKPEAPSVDHLGGYDGRIPFHILPESLIIPQSPCDTVWGNPLQMNTPLSFYP